MYIIDNVFRIIVLYNRYEMHHIKYSYLTPFFKYFLNKNLTKKFNILTRSCTKQFMVFNKY